MSDDASVRADDRAHVFHSWSAQGLIDPMPIAGAGGSYFWDYSGKRYLDWEPDDRAGETVQQRAIHDTDRRVQALLTELVPASS